MLAHLLFKKHRSSFLESKDNLASDFTSKSPTLYLYRHYLCSLFVGILDSKYTILKLVHSFTSLGIWLFYHSHQERIWLDIANATVSHVLNVLMLVSKILICISWVKSYQWKQRKQYQHGEEGSGQRYKLKVKFGVRLSEFEAPLYYTKAVDLKNVASLCHSVICK